MRAINSSAPRPAPGLLPLPPGARPARRVPGAGARAPPTAHGHGPRCPRPTVPTVPKMPTVPTAHGHAAHGAYGPQRALRTAHSPRCPQPRCPQPMAHGHAAHGAHGRAAHTPPSAASSRVRNPERGLVMVTRRCGFRGTGAPAAPGRPGTDPPRPCARLFVIKQLIAPVADELGGW